MSKHGKDTSSAVVGKGGVIAIAVAGWLVVLVLGVVFLLNRAPKENFVPDNEGATGSFIRDGAGVGTVVDENTDNSGQSEQLSYGVFETSMYTTRWIFDRSTMTSEDAYVGNLETNAYDMYFTIEDVNENVLYTSDIITRGSAIESVTLPQDLEPGMYECIMVHHLLEPGTTNEIDGLNLVLNIEIEESGG